MKTYPFFVQKDQLTHEIRATNNLSRCGRWTLMDSRPTQWEGPVDCLECIGAIDEEEPEERDDGDGWAYESGGLGG